MYTFALSAILACSGGPEGGKTTDSGSVDSAVPVSVDQDGDGYGSDVDCDDSSSAVHPGAPEVCDGLDQDCDSDIDEGAGSTWFQDADSDAHGSPSNTMVACDAPTGFVSSADDCDDVDSTAFPGATETCDGDDEDCDGLIDEDVQLSLYVDDDGDGYGFAATEACAPSDGLAEVGGDCDDDEPNTWPGAPEVAYDGLDQDCDGSDLDDLDGDGFPLATDCDDGDASSNPAAPEVAYDAVDQNCDGVDLDDIDGDGFLLATDCDDTDAGLNPGAPEVAYDGIDQDCSGADLDDLDGDGFGVASDCNDGDSSISLAAPEVCNGVDDNCDGEVDEGLGATWFADADADGWGDASVTVVNCDPGAGWVVTSGDCDDGSAARSPTVAEIPYDGIDQDCDGADLDDVDSDGFTALSAGGADCDDAHAEVFPGAVEVPDDTLDNDCDGEADPVAETWTVGESTVDLVTVAVTGMVPSQPDVVVVSAGTGGDGEVDVAGAFVVRMNSTSTGLLQGLDAAGNVVALRLVPKGDGILPPRDVEMSYQETVLTLLLLQPGLAASDPYASAVVLGYARAVADPAALAKAAAELEAHLATDPGGLFNYPDGVQEFLDDLATTVIDDAAASSGMSAMAAAHTGGDAVDPGGFNTLEGGEGDTSDCADVVLTGLDPAALKGTLTVTNHCTRWLSVYLDPDDSTTSLLADGDSQFLGMIKLKEVDIPNTSDLALALVEASWDVMASYVTDPSEVDAYAIFGAALDDELTIWEDVEATYAFDTVGDLAPFQRGRVMLAGAGKGTDGVDPGYRDLPPDLMTYLQVFAVPLIQIAVDLESVRTEVDTSACADLILDFDTYLALALVAASDVNRGDFDASLSSVGALLKEAILDDNVLRCFGIRGIVSPDTVVALIANSLGKAANIVRRIDTIIDLENGFGTFTGWLVTVAATPPGSTYALDVSDRDEDGYRDLDLGGDDCDDGSATINPAGLETCDGTDEDCDGVADDGVLPIAYVDADNDTYGAGFAVEVPSCDLPEGYASEAGDCDDTLASVNPAGVETVDGVDQDCDGVVDDKTSASDDDGDGQSEDAGDCDDSNSAVYVGATEISDGLDNDCDGRVDDTGAWFYESVDTVGSTGRFAAFDLDVDDTPHVAYEDDSDQLVYATKGTYGWTATTLDSYGSLSLADLSVVAASDGTLYVLYTDSNRDDLILETHTSSGWASSTLDSSIHSSVHYSYGDGFADGLETEAGTLFICYSEGNSEAILCGESPTYGFSSASALDPGVLSIVRDDVGGGIGMVVQDNDADDVVFLYIDAGGSVYSSTVESTYAIRYGASLAFDPAGTPNLFYYDDTNMRIRHAEWNGTGWTTSTVVSISTWEVDDLDVAIGPDGTFHLFYTEEYSYEHTGTYLRSSDGTTWTSKSIGSSGDEPASFSLDLDSFGEPHVVYYDDKNYDVVYAYRY